MKAAVHLTDDCEYECPHCGERLVTDVEVDKAGNQAPVDLDEAFIYCEFCCQYESTVAGYEDGRIEI